MQQDTVNNYISDEKKVAHLWSTVGVEPKHCCISSAVSQKHNPKPMLKLQKFYKFTLIQKLQSSRDHRMFIDIG